MRSMVRNSSVEDCKTQSKGGTCDAVDLEAALTGGVLGFLLIDVHKNLNKDNCTTIIWEVQQERFSGTQLTFNFYRHWSTLVNWEGGGALP